MKRIILPNGQQKLKTKFVSVIAAVAVFASVVFILQSCKPKPEPIKTDPPEINSLSITEGQPGATLDIIGKNFKDGTDGVSAYFGSYEATVNSSTSSKIGCTLPDAIPEGTYNVVVSVDGQPSAAFASFTVTEPLPKGKVSGFTPDNKGAGEEVEINGSDFGTDKSIIRVIINEVEQTVLSTVDSKITIELKPKTFSGELQVYKNNVLCETDEDYYYTYNISHSITTFNNIGFDALAVDSFGFVYGTSNSSNLYKMDSLGNVVETILEYSTEISPLGLFYESGSNTLYIGDNKGHIWFLNPPLTQIDTLKIPEDDKNIIPNAIHYLTGDNNGNLYISTGAFKKSIFKYNVNENKSSELIVVEPSNESTWTLSYHDGWVYYSTTNGISSITENGSDTLRLINDYDVLLKNSIFFFYEPLNTFLMSGSSKNMLFTYDIKDMSLVEFISMDQYISYITLDNNNNLIITGESANKTIKLNIF